MSKHAILERFLYYPYVYVILLLPEIVLVIKSIYDNRLLKLEKNTLLHEKAFDLEMENY